MSNPILSEHPRQTAPDVLQAAQAIEPMPDSQLPPDAVDTLLEACRVVLKSGNEPLFRRLLDIGSWLEHQQQQR